MLTRNKGSCIRGCIRMSMVAQTRGVILPLDAALVGTHTHMGLPQLLAPYFDGVGRS